MALGVGEARSVYDGIAACRADARLVGLADDVLSASVAYAHARARWQLASAADRREADAARTRLHEGLIAAVNALSRNAAARGRDIEWRRELGDDRKRIGDFACWCAAFLGIEGR